MLSEFEQIEHSFGAEKAADVRKTLHFLLRHQFVFAGDRGTTVAYNTIMDGRFRDTIDAFFDSCGYRLHRDPEAQWAGIVAADEDVPLPRMKLDETIIALVLAAHWQDEVNIGAVEDRATVVTTLNTLYDRYREMVQVNGRTAVPISRFHEILKRSRAAQPGRHPRFRSRQTRLPGRYPADDQADQRQRCAGPDRAIRAAGREPPAFEGEWRSGMMELRHLALVNWHLFDIEDIEVGGHMGVLGENRSGKSTILDMAQVVLTGGNRKFQRLNAVAGESSKGRGGSPKRSVAGYCLGALGEDQTRRNEARTYIALGFEDSDGMRPPVTIGLALEARKSESNETVLGRFVAVGKVLKSEDFVEVRQGRRYPAQWDDVRARMVSVLGADNFINHRDRPGDYVREYMRHLLPHLPYGEQNAAALQKAVVNAMTMNQNQTATEFVRRFILEENPIRVGELRESIQTYRNINVTIQKMREKLSNT